MSDRDNGGEMPSDLGYMEELSRAYAAALKRRLERSTLPSLPEEKVALLLSLQREIWSAAASLLPYCKSEERRELTLLLRESAEECITLCAGETPKEVGNTTLSRAVLAANRALNLLIRHRDGQDRLLYLILSELSALYALAAIG